MPLHYQSNPSIPQRLGRIVYESVQPWEVRYQNVTVWKVPPPQVVSFTSSSYSIVYGNSATLSWSTRYAYSSVTISGVSVSGTTNNDNQSGTLSVSPARTTTYTLSAVGDIPPNASASLTVEVRYRLTVNNAGSGTSGSFIYSGGQSVSISAGSRSGYTFNGWSGYISSGNNSTSFSMPYNNVTVTANWKVIPPPDEDGGTVIEPPIEPGDDPIPPGVTITISPTSAEVGLNETQPFTGTVTNTGSGGTNYKVGTIGGGSFNIQNSGSPGSKASGDSFNIIPTSDGDKTIQIIAVADTTKTATATLKISTSNIQMPTFETVTVTAKHAFTGPVADSPQGSPKNGYMYECSIHCPAGGPTDQWLQSNGNQVSGRMSFSSGFWLTTGNPWSFNGSTTVYFSRSVSGSTAIYNQSGQANCSCSWPAAGKGKAMGAWGAGCNWEKYFDYGYAQCGADLSIFHGWSVNMSPRGTGRPLAALWNSVYEADNPSIKAQIGSVQNKLSLCKWWATRSFTVPSISPFSGGNYAPWYTMWVNS